MLLRDAFLVFVEILQHLVRLHRHAEPRAGAAGHADALLALRTDVHRPLKFTEDIVVEFLQLAFCTEHGEIRARQHGHLFTMADAAIRQHAKMRRATTELVADLRKQSELRIRHRTGHDAAAKQRTHLLLQIIARQIRVEFHGVGDLLLRRQAGHPERHGIKFIGIQIFADEFIVRIRIIDHDAQADDAARLHERVQILAHLGKIRLTVELRPVKPPDHADALLENHLLRHARHQAARLEHGNDAALLAAFQNHFKLRMQKRLVAFEQNLRRLALRHDVQRTKNHVHRHVFRRIGHHVRKIGAFAHCQE